ncbi:MAG: DUF2225 domain-containing protein [Lachnospiraceae bacterium]|nr:DUF2225 domain-containing protein [Lachnospiraceae bacterium]
MSLLSGLEKFGLGGDEEFNILDDGKEKKTRPEQKVVKKEEDIPEEKDFLMDRKIECPVCYKEFKIRSVKSTKVKRLEPDADLRPKYKYIDTLKYGVSACPNCGYAAMNQDFEHVSSSQRKWIKEAICDNFKPLDEPDMETYTYDYSVDKYKLALVSAMAKHAKLSEKAYICLNIAWLRRAQMESMPDNTPFFKKKKEAVETEYEGFYKQAFDGFVQATQTETPPYAGMDANTVDYLIANMAMHYKKYDVAAKLVSRLVTSNSVNRRMKDKCLDLKERIIEESKKG